MIPTDSMLLRALHAEQRPMRNGEASAAKRMLAAGLIEEFGPLVRWHNRRNPSAKLRLTRTGEAELAKLPKPRSLMLEGAGPQYDCIHEGACLGGFVKAFPRAETAHCPPQCAHRQDVERHAGGLGSSSLAQMQDHAEGV